MKLLEDIESLKSIKEDLEQKIREDADLKVMLTNEETNFFLRKADVYKLADRIEKQYNLKDSLDLKAFLKLESSIELTETQLKTAYKKNDILNKLLSKKEKESLKHLYRIDCKKAAEIKLEVSERKKNEDIRKRREAIFNFIEQSESIISHHEKHPYVNKKKGKKLIELKDTGYPLLLEKDCLLEDEVIRLTSAYEQIEILALAFVGEQKEKKESAKISKEKSAEIGKRLSLECMERANEYKLLQERQLLERINNRKLQLNTSAETTKVLPEDNIIIEAHADDFSSARSRLILSTLHGSNIKISFYNGMIKLIEEDERIHKVSFYTIKDTMTFEVDGYAQEITLGLTQNDRIIDILQEQTSNKIIINRLLDCLSVLYYINTFYNEKDKIEISHLEEIKDHDNIINKEDKKGKSTESIIYLTINPSRRTRVIKIKKGKRSISGASLTRGHLRRQKYTDGVKLIWIEPFWRGKGESRKRVYKV